MHDNGTTEFGAPQQGPRPLPLFLAMLRSETAQDPARAQRALAGLAAFQTASRPPPAPPRPVVARQGRAVLRDGGGDGRPVVLIPSLINPPAILDLDAERSLLGRIAALGHRALLVDWGVPTDADRTLDCDRHVERLLVPLLASVDRPPVLVGYCLGGTLAVAAAARMPVAGLATIAAPWRFAGYGAQARTRMAASWAKAKPTAQALGVLPMEMLQAGFWRLEPARTVAKFEAFAAMPPDSERARLFVRIEDWANAGAPLPYAVARQLFESFVAHDRPGRGVWRVGGTAIAPRALSCPAVEFVSTSDRIVPAATAIGLPDRRESGAGHVGMVVGGGRRAALWDPLADWIGGLAGPR